MVASFPFHPRALRRTALIHLLASGAISAWALNLTLEPPSGPLPAGQKFEAIAKDDHGIAHPCSWILQENGRRVGRAEGLRLDVDREGARFHAPYGEATRTFRLQATSKVDGKAVAEITLQVQPGRLEHYLWATPFTPLDSDGNKLNIHSFAWDPSTTPASIVAIIGEQWSARRPSRVIRIQLDGSHADVATSNALSIDYLDQKPGDIIFHLGQIAVWRDGGLLVSDPFHHKILLLKDGKIMDFAGTGECGFDGDTDQQGKPKAAIQAKLDHPSSLMVTARGEVVFADTGNRRIRRITASGTIETVLDVAAAYAGLDPWTIQPFDCQGIAEAPDGRIVFSDRYNGLIGSFEPGGALRLLAGKPGKKGFDPDGVDARGSLAPSPGEVTVTPDGSVIFVETEDDRVRMITPDNHLVTLAGMGRRPEDGDGKGTPLVTPGRAAFLDTPGMAPVPGGGMLLKDDSGSIRYLGPGRGEPDLVRQVDQAVADAKDHGRAQAGRTLSVSPTGIPGTNRFMARLDQRAVAPTTATESWDLRAATLASNKPALPGLMTPLRGLVYSFLHDPQELAGQAIQATVARHVLLKQLDALLPEGKASEPEQSAARPVIEMEAVD